ncbi:branched-chain amino acid ABC transporter permease [Aquabacterium sp. J223]|uniref:branched-chain amino acid ABC transporter permease n=1 Tax=Aquabacterium sp. J223 TaxID=2898431 RepID=UPI0021AD7873|nr:branched-chain amino acid ABC transporter permease [Aquabacterium sp. J223]UUX95281.1 branched-chain amino acid ABC transporter permease [Aquabacterium sp. J223]
MSPDFVSKALAPVSSRPSCDRRLALRLLGVLTLGLLAVALLDTYALKLVARVYAVWISVVGLQLLVAHSGVMSLGHAAFVAIGAYVAGVLSLAGGHTLWTFLAALLVAGAGAGLLIGVAVLRTQGLYQLMATLAFGQMTYYGLQSQRSLGGDDGFALVVRPSLLPGWSIDVDRAYGAAVVVLGCASAALVARLRASELGARMQAGRDDERRLSSLGVNAFNVKLVAFVVSSALAGLSGGLLAQLSRFASPQLSHWFYSGELLVLVLLSGGSSPLGALLACAALVVLQELLAQYTEHWALALGLLVLARVLFFQRREGRR